MIGPSGTVRVMMATRPVDFRLPPSPLKLSLLLASSPALIAPGFLWRLLAHHLRQLTRYGLDRTLNRQPQWTAHAPGPKLGRFLRERVLVVESLRIANEAKRGGG